MIRVMFSVFDHKAKMYANPFIHVNRTTAMRAVAQGLQNQQDPLVANAKDYELFELGSWDDETGKFFSHDYPVAVCFLNDLIG